MTGGRALTVSQLTAYLKSLLDSDELLQQLWVKGEISNFKHHYASGHMYFTLKDEYATLRCVMFRSRNQQLAFRPANGMKVLLAGYLSVYERDGQYQLYVQEMQPDGLGSLHLALRQLREKLEGEGLFHRKRPIPLLPRKVGVITSLSGAALRDIITVSRRRFPNVDLVVAPVPVEGETAPAEICRALRLMNRVPGVEVIIVGRGGGRLEELWAFNHEEVARGIYASSIPVIAAVGHETDVTIADLVADLRVPTPSAAAERAVPDRSELDRRFRITCTRLQLALKRRTELGRARLKALMSRAPFSRPYHRLDQWRQRVDQVSRFLARGTLQVVEQKRARAIMAWGKLEALNPLAILGRGYSLCRRLPEGCLVKSIDDVRPRDEVEVVVRDGRIRCEVRAVERG